MVFYRISESLLAHIGADAEIKGSGLEGQSFENTIGYLCQYLETIPQESIANLGDLPEQLRLLGLREKTLNKISHTPLYEKYIKDTAQEVHEMQPGTSFFLPGGWTNYGESSAHMMLYRFTKNDKDTLTFDVINSGSGINYHYPNSDTERELYSPIKSYRINLSDPETPKEGEFNKKLARLIHNIIVPTLGRRVGKSYTSEMLYGYNIRTVLALNATEINIDIPSHAYTGSQLSGTCAQRVIHQLLKLSFNSLQKYQIFILNYKLYSLNDYLTQQETHIDIELVNAIHQNNLRIYKLLLKSNSLLEDEIKNIEILLASIRNQIKDAKEVRPKKSPPENLTEQLPTSGEVRLRSTQKILESNVSRGKDPLPKFPPVYPISRDEIKISLSMQKDEITNINVSLYPIEIMARIKEYILALPIDISDRTYYASLSIEELKIIKITIEHIEILYLTAKCYYLNQDSPETNILKIHFIILKTYINEAILKKNQPHLKHNYLTEHARSILFRLLTQFQGSPYLTTYNPLLDIALQSKINKIHTLSFLDIENDVIDVYQNIINTQPQIEKRLALLYKEATKDNPHLHNLISRNNYGALWFAIDNLERLHEIDPDLKPVQLAIKYMYSLQKDLSELHQNIQERTNPNTQLKLTVKIDKYGNEKLILACPISDIDAYFIQPRSDNSTFPLSKNSEISEPLACFNQRRSSNDIQLVPHRTGRDFHKKSRSKEDCLKLREMYHLRSDKSLQVHLTLDYFLRHLSYLNDKDMQIYMEANIFEPPLLLNSLEKIDDILMLFDRLITLGIRTTSNKGAPSQESIFFIRLQFLLFQYLYKFSPDEYGDLLIKFQASTRQMLTTIPVDNTSIRYSLYQYLFMSEITSAQTTQAPEYIADFIKRNINAYFFLHARINTSRTESKVTTLAMDIGFSDFRSMLKLIDKDELLKYIPSAMLAINIDISGLIIENNFPIFIVKDPSTTEILYRIDIYSGLVYNKDNATCVSVPLVIQNDIECRKFGLQNASLCFWFENHYYFPRSDGDIRVIKTENGSVLIQRKWVVDGVESWYEQKIISEDKYKYSVPLYLKFQKNFNGSNWTLWQKCDEPINILIASKNKPAYISNKISLRQIGGVCEEYISFNAIDPESISKTPWKLVNNLEQSSTLAPLLKFDEARFITVLYNSKTNMVKIHFERYDFDLTYNTLEPNKIYLNDTDYILTEDQSPFNITVACLNFINSDGYRKCLIPVQDFIPAQNEAYHTRVQLLHDINSYEKLSLIERILIESRTSIYNYENSEKYITLLFQPDSVELEKRALYFDKTTPIPQTNKPSDSLYLAYIYLASNEPKKAWQALISCKNLGGLQGTLEEVDHILRIINKLGGISKPSFVACQLRALALLTDYLNNNKPIAEPNQTVEDATIPACLSYQNDRSKKRVEFQKNLPNIILKYCSLYQRNLRHLPAYFKLDNIDSTYKILLTYSKNHGALRDDGTLRYIAQYLDLKALIKEKTHLESLENRSSNQEKRLRHIIEHIRTTSSVAKICTRLERTRISLVLPKECPEFKFVYYQRMDQIPKLNIAFTLQDPGIFDREIDIQANFGTYLTIAKNRTVDPEKTEKLRLLIIQKIKELNFYHSKDNELLERSMCIVLYRILTRSDSSIINIYPATDEEYKSDYFQNTINVDFKSIFDQISAFPESLHPIYSYQPQNVHSEILENVEDTVLRISEEIQTPILLDIDQTLIIHQSLHDILKSLAEPFLSFKERFISEEQAYQQELDAIRSAIPENCDADTLFEYEKAAGNCEYQFLLAKRNIAREIFQSQPQNLVTLQEKVAEEILKTKDTISNSWDRIIQTVNESMQNASDALYTELELESLERQEIDKQTLFSLYIQGSLIRYREITLLSDEEITALHNNIHKHLHDELRWQHLHRLKKSIDKAIFDPDNISKITDVSDQCMQENTPDAQYNPAYTFLQHEENILLRKRQVDALTSLSPHQEEPREQVEKIIPGGGKSTTILPLWAQKMANGSNLVIVEVPRDLLHTNYIDLNQTSRKWFGQTPHKLEFDRKSDCSPQALNILFERLIETINDRNYLVTTGESIKSLELKYIEILDKKPKGDLTIWNKQVEILDNILNLLKNHGTTMIDEVHLGLRTKQKLNYTAGNNVNISSPLIRSTLNFYKFIGPITWKNSEDTTLTILEAIKNPRQVKNDLEWDKICAAICQALSEKTNSPLNVIQRKYEVSILDLIAYVQNTLSTKDDRVRVIRSINAMEQEDKDVLAYLKTQLNSHNGVFKKTAARYYRVNYGPSTNQSKTSIERSIAIPYSGNDEPREQSQFADINSAANYTTQAMLINGITRPLIINLIKEWLSDAETEYSRNSTDLSFTYEQTNAARIFTSIMAGSSENISLQNVDLQSENHISAIQRACEQNELLIYDILENNILGQITFNGKTLSSNAYNHVDIYKSVQCTSGTPSNYATYHQRLKYNPKTSVGSDALIMQTALHKNSQIDIVDYDSPDSLLDSLFPTDNQKYQISHAIIDVAAMFQGESNLDVAEKIAKKLSTSKPKIKYVLYFDSGVLYAKSCKDSAPPIRVATTQTDKICNILNCTQNEWFTYYDHVHTTGTNIMQHPQGMGLVLVDHKTTLDECLQGSMRMREFITGEQTLSYIAPKTMKQYKGELLEMMDDMALYQRNSLKKEVFISAIDKLTSTMRNHFLKKILLIDAGRNSALEKHNYLQQVNSLFYTTYGENYFNRYGNITQEDNASNILEEHKQLLLTNKLLSKDDKTQLEETLNEIIRDTLPHCESTQLSTGRVTDELSESENELELHQYTEQIEQLREDHFENYKYNEVSSAKYFLKDLKDRKIKTVVNFNSSPFSKNFYMSYKFANTHDNQKVSGLYDQFIKPAHIIFFSYNDNNEIQACLITNTEYQMLQESGQFSELGWFSDIQGNVLDGNIPDQTANSPEYHALIEQALFFNGDIETLAQKTNYYWLEDNLEEKFEFFENKLLPYRETKKEDIKSLKATFNQVANFEIYKFIANNLYNRELVNYNFKKINRGLKPKELEVCKYIIKTLQNSEIDIHSELPKIQDYMIANHLPSHAFSCVDTYFENIRTLKEFFDTLGKPISTEEMDDKIIRIKKILGMENIITARENQEIDLLIAYFSSIYASTPKMAAINLFYNPSTELTNQQYLYLFEAGGLEYRMEVIHEIISNCNLSNSREKIVVNNNIITKILTHENCTIDIVKFILTNCSILSEDNLITLINKLSPLSTEDLSIILEHTACSPEVVSYLASRTTLNADCLIKIIRFLRIKNPNIKEEIVNLIIDNPNFNENVGLECLCFNFLSEQNFESIITKLEPNVIFTVLLRNDGFNTKVASKLLDHKSLSIEQIQSILNHTSVRFDYIFNKIIDYPNVKNHFNKLFFTKNQLNHIIRHTSDFEILKRSFSHPKNTTREDQEAELFQQIDNNISILFKSYEQQKSPIIKLNYLLAQLQKESLIYHVKSKHKPQKYYAVSKESFQLYQDLNDLKTKFFKNEINAKQFFNRSQSKIDSISKKLSGLRGIKQIIYDFLNAIGFILCFYQLAVSRGKKFRFFEACTKAEITLRDIEKELPNMIGLKT